MIHYPRMDGTAFHALFGEALQPSTGRSVMLDHDI